MTFIFSKKNISFISKKMVCSTRNDNLFFLGAYPFYLAPTVSVSAGEIIFFSGSHASNCLLLRFSHLSLSLLSPLPSLLLVSVTVN